MSMNRTPSAAWTNAAVREHPEAPGVAHSPGGQEADRRERLAVRALDVNGL
jgi:hypothetical protein